MGLRLVLVYAILSVFLVFAFISEAQNVGSLKVFSPARHGHVHRQGHRRGHGYGHGHEHGGSTKILEYTKIFDVRKYGAAANGVTDDSKAFQNAWNDACRWTGKSSVVIPAGTYMVVSVRFEGPCRGPITFLLQGVIKAPTSPQLFFGQDWILFSRVDRLELTGGGTFNGQGASAWPYVGCSKEHGCPNKPLPISVRFNYITNSNIHHITSIDSKNAHFNLFACINFNMSHISINAPGNSPNTDGIHVAYSKNIFIVASNISTGDDCVSMLTTSEDIHISQVRCGPGHGFSIGSLGGTLKGDHITGVTIRNSTLIGTTNGLRIKSWEKSQRCLASNFMFDSIIMDNVQNPIFIDQLYCPYPPCNQGTSQVQIRNVTYKNIKGTSSSIEAVKLMCNANMPCENIKLVNINLSYKGSGGPITSACANAHGKSYGLQSPHPCINNP